MQNYIRCKKCWNTLDLSVLNIFHNGVIHRVLSFHVWIMLRFINLSYSYVLSISGLAWNVRHSWVKCTFPSYWMWSLKTLHEKLRHSLNCVINVIIPLFVYIILMKWSWNLYRKFIYIYIIDIILYTSHYVTL